MGKAKRIGIITCYHNNKNYGGLLQAYALCLFISSKIESNVEQICYISNQVKFGAIEEKNASRFSLKNYFTRIMNHFYRLYNNKRSKVRETACKIFANIILHSKFICDNSNISSCANDYDIFITGSDQVWNLKWFDPNYFLEFVSNDKKKISYAASLGQSSLTCEQQEYFKKALSSFDAISVREKDAVDLLQPFVPNKKIEWVLDPTLLLQRQDWDEISSERRIKEKYLFCYFLGDDRRLRKLAKQYAKKRRLKIVTLPHLSGITKTDIGFGNYKLYDVAPNDFISLIKYSECVFTDSFHACVFSGIYNKNFYVFNRLGMEDMATRLYSLCEFFECNDHFCDTDDKFNMEYIEKLQSVNYDKDFQLLKTMTEKSKKFLKDALQNNYIKTNTN